MVNTDSIQPQQNTARLHWRYNDHDGVSNHQPHGCLLNRLSRLGSKKTSKLRVTGLCVGNSPGPVNSPHKGPVTRKMFPFDDVIMRYENVHISWDVLNYTDQIGGLQLEHSKTYFKFASATYCDIRRPNWHKQIIFKSHICRVILMFWSVIWSEIFYNNFMNKKVRQLKLSFKR